MGIVKQPFGPPPDSVLPRVVSLDAGSALFDQFPIPVVMKLSEAVYAFQQHSVQVSGGYLESMRKVDSSTFHFEIIPIASSGAIEVAVPVGGLRDLAGNTNDQASSVVFSYGKKNMFLILGFC